MFVSDWQTGHPPVLHIGMIAVGNVDRTPAPNFSFVAIVEILLSIQGVKVPDHRRILSVDFEGVQSLVPACVAGGFEGAQ